MSTTTKVATLLTLWLSGSLRLVGQVPSPLARVDQRLDGVADSGTYLVYWYRINNASESRGGAAYFSLDVSAPRGTGFPTLPATGRFMHGAGFRGVDLAQFQDHVPVGPISPTNWESVLTKQATLDWYGGRGGASGEYDNIPPGDSLGGFGLRSPYLPGIRQSWARPTFLSCCAKPRAATATSEAEYPDPSEFKISGRTVGPTVRPEAMTLGLVRADLAQVCGALRWIPDGAMCGPLQATLARAAAAAQRGDRSAATDALRAFVDALDAQHGPGKPVNDNAYWLLKVNGEYLLTHM